MEKIMFECPGEASIPMSDIPGPHKIVYITLVSGNGRTASHFGAFDLEKLIKDLQSLEKNEIVIVDSVRLGENPS